jgi:predicted SAM-dependent methyltransferase
LKCRSMAGFQVSTEVGWLPHIGDETATYAIESAMVTVGVELGASERPKRVSVPDLPKRWEKMKTLVSTVKAAIGFERRKQLRRAASKFGEFGLSRYCPCCNSYLRSFKTYGVVPRPEARCPICGALERHRLMYLYLTQKTDLFNGRRKKMLHVAPERELSRWFQKTEYIDYLSADLSSSHAMVRMDISDIQYVDNTFDVIYCSHVLEHVPDDRKALREFWRVLKIGGWAILQVPITSDVTFEDPTVTSPAERERLFGQHDHVRRYGPDYRNRLVEAGFSVTVDGFARELDDKTATRYGLRRSEDVFVCRKQATSDPFIR